MTTSTIVIDYPQEAVSVPRVIRRIALAIVSYVLLVPLCAITAALVVPLTDSLPGWDGAIITTCAQAVVCAVVFGVYLALGAGKGRASVAPLMP